MPQRAYTLERSEPQQPTPVATPMKQSKKRRKTILKVCWIERSLFPNHAGIRLVGLRSFFYRKYGTHIPSCIPLRLPTKSPRKRCYRWFDSIPGVHALGILFLLFQLPVWCDRMFKRTSTSDLEVSYRCRFNLSVSMNSGCCVGSV